jgi:hypothetical protein
VAARRGVAAACVLGVSDVPAVAQAAGGARGAAMPSVAQAAGGARGAAMPFHNGTGRLGPDDIAELGVRIGEAGYAAVRSR